MQRTMFDRRVRRLGFTRSQWLVLRRLGIQPGASQVELADLLEVEKTTAGRLIDINMCSLKPNPNGPPLIIGKPAS